MSEGGGSEADHTADFQSARSESPSPREPSADAQLTAGDLEALRVAAERAEARPARPEPAPRALWRAPKTRGGASTPPGAPPARTLPSAVSGRRELRGVGGAGRARVNRPERAKTGDRQAHAATAPPQAYRCRLGGRWRRADGDGGNKNAEGVPAPKAPLAREGQHTRRRAPKSAVIDVARGAGA